MNNVQRRAERGGSRGAWLAATMLVWSALGVGAATVAAETYALYAGTIFPVTPEQPGPVTNGVLVVQDGRILGVGRDVAIPRDAVVVRFPDAVICPGFIAASSGDVGLRAGVESVSGAYAAVDAYDRYSENVIELAHGVTTKHLDPGGHRLVSGVGAVVKLAGPAEARVLVPAADICINLGVFDPPPVVDIPFYASADQKIEAARLQRPQSRLTQFLELHERIALAGSPDRQGRFDYHQQQFAEAWNAGLPLRAQVRAATDIEKALQFAKLHGRATYLVGLAEADAVVAELLATRLPLVLQIEREFRFPGENVGPSPDVIENDLKVAGAIGANGLRVALAGKPDAPSFNPQMIGAMALRGGMSPAHVLAGLTRVPAEVLGVAERVGSLAPGKDADFVVLSGPPLELSSRVLETWVNGKRVFTAPPDDGNAVVIKAGAFWLGDGHLLRDGQLLIADGKIKAIGQRVPAPRFAKLIDAGPSGFVTPGFIDAHGHLGLEGDRSVAGPDLPIERVVGIAGREFVRVARAGVTSVLLSAYRAASDGARIAAIKTYGEGVDDMVTRAIAGVKLDFTTTDPLALRETLKGQIEKAQKYEEAWKKYDEALKKWEADKAAGKEIKPKEVEEVVTDEKKADPITGTWEFRLSGGPLPEEVVGTMRLKLTGNQIEGRATVPISDEEAVLTGTLEGDSVRMEMDEETPVGKPTIEAKLDREDHMQGQFKLGDQFSIDFAATRTNKDAVEFKVQRRKRRSEDGRPLAPKIEPALEPYRAVLAGKAPLVAAVRDAAQAEAVVAVAADGFKLPLVLLNAEGIPDLAQRLEKPPEHFGVIVPPRVVRERRDLPYNQAADLALRGIRIAFQSDAEDAARDLPLVALYSVQQGLGGDAALKALTSDAAALFKLDDRIGALEVGRDGDILIFDGHPFDAGSQLKRVLVNGREVPPLEDAP